MQSGLRPGRLVRWWRYFWAGSGTLLGVAAALGSFALPRVSGPIAVCRADRGFARWFLTRRGYCAITLGHVVLVTREAPADVLVHEMVHVWQGERWGPLFIPAYLAAMGVAKLRGRHPYWENPFEIEAREHEACVAAAGSSIVPADGRKAVGTAAASGSATLNRG